MSVGCAQTVAIISPAVDKFSQEFSSRLGAKLGDKIRVLDADLVAAAAQSSLPETPYNQTTGETRDLADLVGATDLLVLRVGTQRRASLDSADYFESFAGIFVASGRTGHLIHFELSSCRGSTVGESERDLLNRVDKLGGDLLAVLRRKEDTTFYANFPAFPTEGESQSVREKPPMPYNRIKPESSAQAYLFGVTATVDVLVDIDSVGVIKAVEPIRWAGFGLEQQVETAVRAMKWSPATRNGKPLDARVLLRYNFIQAARD